MPGQGRVGWLQFQHQALNAVGAQPHFQVVGRHDHLLDQQLDDARLLGWEELAPNGVEPRHRDGDLGLVIQRAVGIDKILQRAKAGDARSLDACAHCHRSGVQIHESGHHFAGALVTQLQLKRGTHLAVAVHAAGRDQPGNHLSLRFALEQMLEGAKQQEEGGQALLAVDHFVVVLLIGRRHQPVPMKYSRVSLRPAPGTTSSGTRWHHLP